MTDASFPPSQRYSNGRVSLEAAGRTDVGRRRPHNEDTLGLLPVAYEGLAGERGYLFAVADGMGGAEKGEVASRLAVEALFATYYDATEPDLPPEAALRAAFATANNVVYNEGLNLAFGMMGTTLVAALVTDDRLIVGNVGDSRAYLIRDGTLRQITEDHSLVEEQVRAGILTPAQARASPQRNIITRAIGHQAEVEDDQYTIAPLQAGDVVLLCSDGMHGMVEDAEMLALAQQPDLSEAAAALVGAANDRGGHDNITVLLVRIQSAAGSGHTGEQATTYIPARSSAPPPTQRRRRPPPDSRRGGVRMVGIAGAVVVVGSALALGVGLLGRAASGGSGGSPTPTPFSGMRVSGRVELPDSVSSTPLGMYVAVDGPAAQRLSARVGSDARYQLELPPEAAEGTYTLAVRPEQIGAGDVTTAGGIGTRRVAVYPPRSVALRRGSDVVVDLPFELVEERRVGSPALPAVPPLPTSPVQ